MSLWTHDGHISDHSELSILVDEPSLIKKIFEGVLIPEVLKCVVANLKCEVEHEDEPSTAVEATERGMFGLLVMYHGGLS